MIQSDHVSRQRHHADARLAIAPVVYLLVSGQRWPAWWVFLAACATDLVDGLVARKLHEVTRLGKVLDPLVDKALYVSVLFTLYAIGLLPTLAVVLFLIPQVGIGIGALPSVCGETLCKQRESSGRPRQRPPSSRLRS